MRLVLGCEIKRPTLKVDLKRCIIRVSEREELGVYGALLLSIHLIVVIYLLDVYDITSFSDYFVTSTVFVTSTIIHPCL